MGRISGSEQFTWFRPKTLYYRFAGTEIIAAFTCMKAQSFVRRGLLICFFTKHNILSILDLRHGFNFEDY